MGGLGMDVGLWFNDVHSFSCRVLVVSHIQRPNRVWLHVSRPSRLYRLRNPECANLIPQLPLHDRKLVGLGGWEQGLGSNSFPSSPAGTPVFVFQ